MNPADSDHGHEPVRVVRHRRSTMPAAPLNQADIRRANAWSVLQAVRAAGIASRSRVAASTGLNPMSVHRLIAQLDRHQLVVPAGMTEDGSVGRPSSLFRFNASIGSIAGVDVGNETTRAVLADLDRVRYARREIPTAEIEDDLAGGVERLVGELREQAGPGMGPLVGISVGVPAVAGPDGTIVRASQHDAWEGLELGGHLRRVLGADVIVRQDDHLAAYAELQRGACIGIRTAVVLDVGKGIGIGVIADGAVLGGHHHAAGRVAWIPIPDGPFGSGRSVPLGDLLTADGLTADFRRLGGTGPVDGARAIFTADAGGDAAATQAIDLFANRLGWLIGAIVAIVDPELVVVGGGISGSYARLASGVEARLASIIANPPPVVASPLGLEAVVTGALNAALGIGDAWLQERLHA